MWLREGLVVDTHGPVARTSMLWTGHWTSLVLQTLPAETYDGSCLYLLHNRCS